MARIKWNVDYGRYKAGSEHEVSSLKNLQKHIAAGRMEVLDANTAEPEKKTTKNKK